MFRLTSLAVTLALTITGTTATPAAAPAAHSVPRTGVDFRSNMASPAVRHIARWAVHSGNHGQYPFIIIDKVDAKLFAFDGKGRLIRSTPVLIGMGTGDRFAPGVIDMDMYQTQPWQRITPAGRYFAREDLNLEGERVLWVDYDAGIAIHKMAAKRTRQRRHERLASSTPRDNRITYGCINVPVSFYKEVVRRYFGRAGGIVYVLPEERSANELFGSYDVVARAASMPADQVKPRSK